MQNNIFQLIDQGMNRKTYSLAEDFEEKKEVTEKYQKKTQDQRVSQQLGGKKAFENRSKLVRTPARQKTEERQKVRDKKLFFAQ